MNASGSSSQGRRGRKPPAESGAEPIVTTIGHPLQATPTKKPQTALAKC